MQAVRDCPSGGQIAELRSALPDLALEQADMLRLDWASLAAERGGPLVIVSARGELAERGRRWDLPLQCEKAHGPPIPTP